MNSAFGSIGVGTLGHQYPFVPHDELHENGRRRRHGIGETHFQHGSRIRPSAFCTLTGVGSEHGLIVLSVAKATQEGSVEYFQFSDILFVLSVDTASSIDVGGWPTTKRIVFVQISSLTPTLELVHCNGSDPLA